LKKHYAGSNSDEKSHVNPIGDSTIRYESEDGNFYEATLDGLNKAVVTKVLDIGEKIKNKRLVEPIVAPRRGWKGPPC
jgi:hypothetical protein